MTIKDLNQSCCKMLLVFLISTTLMLTSHAQVFQDEGLVKIITITLLFGLTLEISREQQLTIFPPYPIFLDRISTLSFRNAESEYIAIY